tara:strand:- start:131 stop:289 length:159 start_codon:yes stop_codon:yes gene_type:complete
MKKIESKKKIINKQKLNLKQEIDLLRDNLRVKDLEIGRMMEKINQLKKSEWK